ncbi:MAG: hypothetical protein OEV08_03515 [Nitrospira sp.]|nr:hypothetical protein [Nitrospira sp.]
MPSCEYCHREFINEYAKHGHYRACPSKPQPELKRPALCSEIGSAAEPGSADSAHAEIRSPRRSVHASNYVLRTIEAFDLLAGLRKRAQERLWFYKVCGHALGTDRPTFEEWYQLTADLLCCERDVGDLVQRALVSRDRVWTVYLKVIDVQERWLPWAELEVERLWVKREKGDKATREEKAVEYGLPLLKEQFERLADLLRRLTAMTRLGI